MKPTLIRASGEFPPSGFPFLDPITGKSYRDLNTTFDARVKQIINDRMVNQRLVSNAKYYSPSYVAQELSEYVCEQLKGNSRWCSQGTNTVRSKQTRSQRAATPAPSQLVVGLACKFCGATTVEKSTCVSCGGKITYTCKTCKRSYK